MMVHGVTIREFGSSRAVALDDPVLHHGWWVAETDGATLWRWTDGAAELPAIAGPAILMVRADPGRYRLDAPVAAKARARR